MLHQLRQFLRVAAVRRWLKRQSPDTDAYEIDGYIRARWSHLTEDERRAVIGAAIKGPSKKSNDC
jgi:hypothetical protein